MKRHELVTACLSFCLASVVLGQVGHDDKEPPAVVELLEDDTAFFEKNLTNPGAEDGSIPQRSEDSFFSGSASLVVTPFQRFHPNLPQWSFKIAKNPGPGEYRYLRFAWKRTEGPGIMLQLHARPATWRRYYAGTLSKQTQSWGDMTRVDDDVPREWKVMTRDLFKDFGPITITGLGLSALDGPGEAYFDHIYLGRTVEDLDRVTSAKQSILDPPAEAGAVSEDEFQRALLRVLAFAALACALVIGFIAWRRRSKAKTAAHAGIAGTSDGTAGAMIGLTCTACGKHLKVKQELAGKRVKCPGCGAGLVAP